MAWKGESRRHSLARKGIRTADGKLISKKEAKKYSEDIDKIAKIVGMARGKLHGLAKKKGITEKDVDPDELKMGIKVEMEHTDDPEVAKQIALDHLAEFENYYTELIRLEKKLEAESHGIPKSRIFNGKKYDYHASYYSRDWANFRKEALEDRGYDIREVKAKDGVIRLYKRWG